MSDTLNKKFRYFLNHKLAWFDKIPYMFGFKSERIAMPDFLIIGMPKCGTWWLARQLDNHPQIELKTNPWNSNKGEVRFFSKNFLKPIKDYFQLFSDQNGKLKFEKSPDYCLLSKARIKLIKKLNHKIKIILILRDPVNRAFSNANMDLLRKKGIGLEAEHLYKKHFTLNSRLYNYEIIVIRWFEVFKANLLVLNFKQIYLNPGSIIKQCCNFLDVEYNDHFWDKKPVNQTESVELPQRLKLFLSKINSQNIEYYKNIFR